jgi:hypothetical protein
LSWDIINFKFQHLRNCVEREFCCGGTHTLASWSLHGQCGEFPVSSSRRSGICTYSRALTSHSPFVHYARSSCGLQLSCQRRTKEQRVWSPDKELDRGSGQEKKALFFLSTVETKLLWAGEIAEESGERRARELGLPTPDSALALQGCVSLP